MSCPEQDVKLVTLLSVRDSGPWLTKEQMLTMMELDNVEKNEKLPIGLCCDRLGLLHPTMYSEAMVFVKKPIASGTGGMLL